MLPPPEGTVCLLGHAPKTSLEQIILSILYPQVLEGKFDCCQGKEKLIPVFSEGGGICRLMQICVLCCQQVARCFAGGSAQDIQARDLSCLVNSY